MQRAVKQEDPTTATLVKHLKDLTARMDNMERNYDVQIKTLKEQNEVLSAKTQYLDSKLKKVILFILTAVCSTN
jgi:uncharacterized coiled-coil protein SlyX